MVKADYTAFIDGASSGNPGHSGIGIVIYNGKDELLTESKYIGETTNNVAEYTALTHLLDLCQKYNIKKIRIYSDSELLVKQLSGEYKVKNENLKKFMFSIFRHKSKINFTVDHVPRERNKEADKLAKAACKKGGEI